MPVRLPELPQISPATNEAPRISDTCGLEDIDRFEYFQHKLEIFASGGSFLSQAAKIRKDEIENLLREGAGFSSIIRSRRDSRLLFILYRENLDLYKSRPINNQLFKLIGEHNSPIPSSLLRQYIRLYLEEYDRLAERNLLTKIILQELEGYSSRPRVPNDIKAYLDNAVALFGKNAPQNFVKRAQTSSQASLVNMAKSLKVPHTDNARFFELVTQVYYLETLKSIDFGEEHQVMNEIKQTSVKESIGPSGLMIGQLASKILIERCLSKKVAMPDSWRDFVLAICTDPRVPKRNRNFSKWWAPLDNKHIDAMKKWLSKMDLALFLKLLEEYAIQSNNRDMSRMLPGRKKFLEGLLEENLVINSRLILSYDAARSLKRGIHRDNLPVFATVTSGEQCMIYLDLGEGKLIEGSHNFAARVYRDFDIPGLADYTRTAFYPQQITQHQALAKIPHSKSKRVIWQHNLIKALKSKPIGLKFSPEKVLTRSDWLVYKKVWGMN